MADRYSSPSAYMKKDKTPTGKLNSLIESFNAVVNSPAVKKTAAFAADTFKKNANAYKQAAQGFVQWSTPPPISPLGDQQNPERVYNEGGYKQAVNNVVAGITGQPELVRQYPKNNDSFLAKVGHAAVTLGMAPIRGIQYGVPGAYNNIRSQWGNPQTAVIGHPAGIMPSPTPTASPTPYPTMARAGTPSVGFLQGLLGNQPTATPTPTTQPTPTPTPGVTPYPTPAYKQEQLQYKDTLTADAGRLGVNPDVLVGIGNNESSLKPTTTPNINDNEESYGPFQINFKIKNKDGTVTILKDRGGLTREDAQDYNKAIIWVTNRLKKAAEFFPESTDRQILYYNVPGNVFRTADEGGGIRPAEELSYQAAWYLANALKATGKTPSEEYLPILQQYGFFK